MEFEIVGSTFRYTNALWIVMRDACIIG